MGAKSTTWAPADISGWVRTVRHGVTTWQRPESAVPPRERPRPPAPPARRGARRRATAAQMLGVRSMYLSGMTIRGIADLTGRSYSSVHWTLKRLGVEF